MTIRMTYSQAVAYRLLTDEGKTPKELQATEATLDALVRAGYAVKVQGIPPLYKRGPREL